jgi:hypothetical protein
VTARIDIAPQANRPRPSPVLEFVVEDRGFYGFAASDLFCGALAAKMQGF